MGDTLPAGGTLDLNDTNSEVVLELPMGADSVLLAAGTPGSGIWNNARVRGAYQLSDAGDWIDFTVDDEGTPDELSGPGVLGRHDCRGASAVKLYTHTAEGTALQVRGDIAVDRERG